MIISIGAVAIAIGTIADLQLHAFVARRTEGAFIRSGLWSGTRHPNDFGELAFWWSLMLFGLACAPAHGWWIVPGALAVTAMFRSASIPLMDRFSLEASARIRGGVREGSALFPLRPPLNRTS